MSQQNLEALQRLYEEWANGNLWALSDIADPGIEWEWSPSLASLQGTSRIHRGLDDIAKATLEWLETWDSYWMTAEDYFAAGDRVVVPMTLHARTEGTEAVLEQRTTGLWTFRDGRVVHVRYYDDEAAAFEAAGLSRQERASRRAP